MMPDRMTDYETFLAKVDASDTDEVAVDVSTYDALIGAYVMARYYHPDITVDEVVSIIETLSVPCD